MFEFHGTSFYTTTVGGNARWAAPEIICITNNETNTNRTVTTQSDVYSFGSIMLEVSEPASPSIQKQAIDQAQTFTGRRPYHYLHREVQVLLELQNGNKPRRPTESCVTDWIWEKINQCWADCPEDRPCMTSMSESLRRRLHDLSCLRALRTRTQCEEEPLNRGPLTGSGDAMPLTSNL